MKNGKLVTISVAGMLALAPVVARAQNVFKAPGGLVDQEAHFMGLVDQPRSRTAHFGVLADQPDRFLADQPDHCPHPKANLPGNTANAEPL